MMSDDGVFDPKALAVLKRRSWRWACRKAADDDENVSREVRGGEGGEVHPRT